MAYATVNDLLEVLSEKDQLELTDDDATDGEEVVTDLIQKALNRSISIVNSYLSKRFDLPLATTPESVKDATLVITKRKLYARRDYSPDGLLQEYKETMEWLKDVANGVADLPEVMAGESEGVSSFGFGQDSMFEEQIW